MEWSFIPLGVKKLAFPFTGTRVIQVSATDNEDDAISYEIGSDAAGRFSIDQTAGWITSNVTIDREVNLYYTGKIKRFWSQMTSAKRRNITTLDHSAVLRFPKGTF